MNTYLIKNDENFHVQMCKGFKPANAIATVSNDVAKDDYPYLYAELELDEETQIESWVIKINNIAKGEAINSQFVIDEKKRLRAEYIADIDAEMTNIYATVDRDKASSLYLTWRIWIDDPAFFSDKGFTDDLNQPLDTASKITNYANQKINLCKSYSVFLMTREKQYRDAVALLGE